MAKVDKGNYHNFRLSKCNAQHVSVNKILRDLNPDVVKSKNQYIVDAIEYYTNALDKDDLTLTGAIEKEKRNSFVTRGDLEKIKREIRDGILIEMQKEMLALLGTFTGNMANSFPSVARSTVVGAIEPEEFDVETDDTMDGLATKWG